MSGLIARFLTEDRIDRLAAAVSALMVSGIATGLLAIYGAATTGDAGHVHIALVFGILVGGLYSHLRTLDR